MSGGPPCSQLRRPKGRWQQPRLDRCIRLDAGRVSGLPPLPLSLSILSCWPRPRCTCLHRERLVRGAQWRPLQLLHRGSGCPHVVRPESGFLTPAVGQRYDIRLPLPCSEEPRTKLLAARGHQPGCPMAKRIDFCWHLCSSFLAHHLGSSELHSA